MLSKIDLELYDIFSDKTYSESCIIKVTEKENINNFIYSKVGDDLLFYAEANYEFSERDIEKGDECYYLEIIGHEPTFQDIALKCKEWLWNWQANSNNWLSFSEGDCRIGGGIEYDFTKKLINQSENTKRAIAHTFYIPG